MVPTPAGREDDAPSLPTPVPPAAASATIGWMEPNASVLDTLFALRENYYPGDVGFDPLRWKLADAKDFATIQTKELQHGRLAMIGVWGYVCTGVGE